MWIIGVRSFAAEVADWASDAGDEVSGLLDPSGNPPESPEAHGLPIDPLQRGAGGEALVGTGEIDRRATVARALRAGIELRGLTHPSAHVSRAATVHPSAVIGPGVVVGAAATIGEHVVLGRGTLIGHHTVLGAFEHQEMPFEMLVEALHPAREAGRKYISVASEILGEAAA